MKKAVLIIASVLTLGAGLASSASAVSLPQYFVDPENGADSATCGGSSLANPATGPCQSLNQAMQNGCSDYDNEARYFWADFNKWPHWNLWSA